MRFQIHFRVSIAFFVISIVSILVMIIRSPESAFPAMIDGATGAITLALKLIAIYAVWLSVLKMMEATALDKKLSRIMKPVVKRLFKKESDEAYDWICINLSANMLGMGGVATPAGIKAMSAMQDNSDKITNNMALLLVINTTSIQLIPATVIALRATAGSQNPADIILPTLISSGIATVCGGIICKILSIKNNDDKTCAINNKRTLCGKNNMLKPLSCNLRKNSKRSKSTK